MSFEIDGNGMMVERGDTGRPIEPAFEMEIEVPAPQVIPVEEIP
jgi:hypothetical protein